MVVACFHSVGMLPEIQILLYIFRRYFVDIFVSSRVVDFIWTSDRVIGFGCRV